MKHGEGNVPVREFWIAESQEHDKVEGHVPVSGWSS